MRVTTHVDLPLGRLNKSISADNTLALALGLVVVRPMVGTVLFKASNAVLDIGLDVVLHGLPPDLGLQN